MRRWLAVGLIWFVLAITVRAWAAPPVLAQDTVTDARGVIHLTEGWRSRSGDDLGWALPSFDDSSWEETSFTSPHGHREPPGISWHRLRLQVSSEAVGRPVHFFFLVTGAMELYVDGRLVTMVGKVGDAAASEHCMLVLGLPQPVPVTFDRAGEHVLALRLSNHHWLASSSWRLLPSFYPGATLSPHGLTRVRTVVFRSVGVQAIALGMSLFVVVLSVGLWLLVRRERHSLAVGAFAASLAGVFMTDVAELVPVSLDFMAWALSAFSLLALAVMVLGVWALSVLLELRAPWRLYGLGALAPVTALLSWFLGPDPLQVYILGGTAVWLSLVVQGVWRRAEGAWLVGSGFTVLLIMIAMSLVIVDRVWVGVLADFYTLGVVVLLGTMALHVARRQRKVEVELGVAEEKARLLAELDAAYARLRQTQVELVQSEKMASLSRLTAGVAHELNSPAGALAANLDTAERAVSRLAPAKDDRAARALAGAVDGMRVAVGRIGEIVERLKRFVNLDESEKQRVDLNAELEHAALAAAPLLEGTTVIRDLADLPVVECWPREVKQAIYALLENAAQASHDGGRITLRSRARDDRVVVEVTDEGRGMSPASAATLFDFRFSAERGRVKLGLGLASAWHVMQEHGGRIEVDSEEGKGSTFRLIFPRS